MPDRPVQRDLFGSRSQSGDESPVTRVRPNVIVEAGAGTGKTTDIVCRVLERLLDEPELDPAAIVLITFTEKAAAEIAERVRFALASIHQSFDDAEPAWRDSEGHAIFAVPEEKRDAWRRACAVQIARLDRLRSQTIHSFCQSILRRFPLEAGLDPQFGIVEGFERAIFIDEIYGRWIERETSSAAPPSWTDQWSLVFEGVGGLVKIHDAITGTMLDRRDMIVDDRYSLGDVEDVVEHIRIQIDALRAVDPVLIERLDDDAVRELATWFRENDAPESPSLGDLIEWIEPIESLMNNASFAKGSRAVTGPLGKLRQKSNWKSSLRPNGTILEILRQQRVALALRAMATRFYEFLDEEKRRLGVLDFDDLLIRTEILLRDERVLDGVRARYRYIFVDEFQDTDRVQAQIVLRLAKDASGAFVPGRTVLVGDPKQAIYSFRRADPEMYASTVQQFIEGGAERNWLDRQYRSDPSLLAELNALFANVFGDADDDSSSDGRSTRSALVFQPRYKQLEAARATMLPALPARLRFLQAPRGDAPTDDVAQARAIAAWIEHERGEGGYRRFAILLRRLSKVQHYVDTLERAGIPIVLPPMRSPLDHPAVVDLLTVLRAIALPFDRGAVLSAARSPWFGLGDDEIARHHLRVDHDEPCGVDRCEETLARWREETERMTVSETIAHLLDETSMEVAWSCLHGGDRAVGQIDRVRRLADEWDRSSGGSLREFVAELGRRRAEGRDVDPPQVDDDIDAVRIMTVHGAKGLEFETVILPDLCPRTPSDHLRVSAIDQTSSLVFTGNVLSLSALFTKADGMALIDVIKEREKNENDRLFYVAVTRAKSDVVFVLQDDMSKQGFFRPLAAALELDKANDIHGFWPEKGEPYRRETFRNGEREVTATFHRSSAIETSGERQRFATEAVAWVVDSATADEPREPDRPPEVPPDRGALRKRRAAARNRSLGILVHRVLEIWDGDDTTLDRAVGAIAREQGADEATLDRARRQLARLTDSPALARIAGARTIGRELAIWTRSDDGRAREMRIDRLIDEGGSLAVVDYKTGRADDDRLEVDREQVQRYCRAIEAISGSPCRGLLWYIGEDRDEMMEV